MTEITYQVPPNIEEFTLNVSPQPARFDHISTTISTDQMLVFASLSSIGYHISVPFLIFIDIPIQTTCILNTNLGILFQSVKNR